jgi:hypothetical protein
MADDHELIARIEERLAGLDRECNIRFEQVQQDVRKTAEEVANRFTSVNEFRAQLSDQAATLIRRTEVEQLIRAGDERLQLQIQANAKAIDDMKGIIDVTITGARLGQRALITLVGVVIAAIAAGLAILTALH